VSAAAGSGLRYDAPMAKTLLAMGAHYDDCVFGIPGILLQAVRKHYRVVILSLIGDYRDWAPIGSRHQELVAGATALAKEHGAEARFLRFQSHLFEVTAENKRAVSEVVAEIQPEIAFVLWPHDHHDDHVAASQLSSIALRNAGQILGKSGIRPPAQIYYYDNGPRHTVGFEPDTFVDIGDKWPAAIDWLGKLMALVRNEPYRAGSRDGAQQLKETLAMYRAKTCGVRYAEAVRAEYQRAREIL
jgi:LmbE family N-acetylglucosaminyl deacetylase